MGMAMAMADRQGRGVWRSRGLSWLVVLPLLCCSLWLLACGDGDGAATAAEDPTSVVSEYFSRMQAHDVRVLELFHDDATLIGLGFRKTGRAEIDEFYTSVISSARPAPRAAGPLLSGGSRVAAEIYIDLTDGSTLHVVDVFVVEEGRIRSLTYFLADDPGA